MKRRSRHCGFRFKKVRRFRLRRESSMCIAIFFPSLLAPFLPRQKPLASCVAGVKNEPSKTRITTKRELPNLYQGMYVLAYFEERYNNNFSKKKTYRPRPTEDTLPNYLQPLHTAAPSPSLPGIGGATPSLHQTSSSNL